MVNRRPDLVAPGEPSLESEFPSLSSEPSTVNLLVGWGIGVLVLAGLVGFILHFGDLSLFIATLKSADPSWLAAALIVQAATYVCAAAIWAMVMAKAGHRKRIPDLLCLAVVELFANQAIPTGGLSGSLMVVRGLIKRAVPSPIAITALLVAAISYYAAYLLVAFMAFALLWYGGELTDIWFSLSIAFSGVVVLIAALLLLVAHSRGRFIPRRMLSWPPIARTADMLAKVRRDLLSDGTVLAQATALQAAIFLLDAATLWLALRAIGVHIELSNALVCFILASVVATLSPLPLGLGPFEGSCVALLHLLGVQVEMGLAATLMLRGFTFWLPMLPGLWLIGREAREKQTS
ncbi:flippase-like domain-containing protein [Rhizobium sp. NLR9b]|uniref:lysylphosphatidylglycerol synthase transmembrane domain-containing protein n=1 Tax=unclassified Rhizobium TaxID=2613769 RepID=UPI001C83B87A|nr:MULTISPECIES: lysylphosphatidylglycerol synthase transmembrane domain-containing protein [unclassified Rhizobium]MBX5227334.1 flippase-like domain-containing protein [Rhizobium sp. NLR9b]MBX5288378.1 flippase-like domain-containing protein [Rhizobium sp. NLR10b]